MTLIKKLPLDKSNAWKKFQTLTPVLIAAKQDVVYTVSEWYRDKIEPFYKGDYRTFQIREFAFINGIWKHVELTVTDTCNIQQQKAEFESMGFHVTLRTTNTIKELKDAHAGQYTEIVTDEWFLNDVDEVLEISCFCKGTICEEGFALNIPVPELEDILIELREIEIDGDGGIIDQRNYWTYDDIYEWWETFPTNPFFEHYIIFTYLSKIN